MTARADREGRTDAPGRTDVPSTSEATGPAGTAGRTGVWFIGARGSVATTATAGCAAIAAGLHQPTGMVTETPPSPTADCPP